MLAHLDEPIGAAHSATHIEHLDAGEQDCQHVQLLRRVFDLSHAHAVQEEHTILS